MFSSIELIFIYNRTKQGGSIMARNEETIGTIYGDFKILNKDKEKSLEKNERIIMYNVSIVTIILVKQAPI